MELAGTIVAHDTLVRALEERGYDTRAGAWLFPALEHFLADHGYPTDGYRPIWRNDVMFLGAAEGAVPILTGEAAWFAGSSLPARGAPADGPRVVPAPAPLATTPADDGRRAAMLAAAGVAGIGGAILVGLAIAASRKAAA